MIILLASSLPACGSADIKMPFSEYNKETDVTAAEFLSAARLPGFASDVAAYTEDVLSEFMLEHAEAGVLINLNKDEPVFSQNAFEKMYPASITKIMTAYVALKYCSLDETVTCRTPASAVPFSDAVILGLKEGDYMTLEQALHLALPSSYNDVAIAIAEHVSGSEEAFAELMNEEAKKLGATGTHFTNSHGLPDDDHYTTAYDLYLIFNAVVAIPDMVELMSCKEYQTTYHSKTGADISAVSRSTNQYFKGNYPMPDSVTVVGGKTGTTDEAGYCLALYVRDASSTPYIAIILSSDSRDDLYGEMTEMLAVLTN